MPDDIATLLSVLNQAYVHGFQALSVRYRSKLCDHLPYSLFFSFSRHEAGSIFYKYM